MTDGPDMEVKRCAKCAAWIPATATMCAYCNTTRPDEPPARPRGPVLSLRHGFSATSILIAANFAYFAFSLFAQFRFEQSFPAAQRGNPLQWALTGSGLFEGLVYSAAYVHGAVVEQHQWWRVLGASFLHGGGIHLVLNMLALKQLGDLAENLFGTAKFLTVYFVSGACCALGISVWYSGIRGLPDGNIHPMVGASGAIFGVAGLLTVYLLRAGTERGRAVAMTIGRNILLMLLLGLVVKFISQVGHVGGLLPGLAFGLVMRGEFGNRLNQRTRDKWAVAASAGAAVAVASLVAGAWFAMENLGGR